MKKFFMVLAIIVLFQSLSFAETMTEEASIHKLDELLGKFQRVLHSKFIIAGKEVAFIPKRDRAGNALILGFYDGIEADLEEQKKEISAITPPPDQIEMYKLLEEAINYRIAATGKAIEAHEKDDVNIMENEGANLISLSTNCLYKLMQELEKWKQGHHEI